MKTLMIGAIAFAAIACQQAQKPATASSTGSSNDGDGGSSADTTTEDGGVVTKAAGPNDKDGPRRPLDIPKECGNSNATRPDGGADSCVVGNSFAKRLCEGAFPDMALALMTKGFPFTHMFLRGDVDGWNADGGMSTRAKLSFDEEVLLLYRRPAPANSIVVGSGGSVQVMRWDGTCYTLDEGELTTRRPPSAKNAPILWRRLTDKTKDELLKNERILAAFKRRGKECKGASSGEVSKACELADAALSASVVNEVRGGMLITPDPLP